jgi:hypothetical protein
VATWATDKAKIISVSAVSVIALLGWTGNQLWSSFEARGESLLELQRRQVLIETKADDDRALLQECRDGVKEVRDDVKELLRRSPETRPAGKK